MKVGENQKVPLLIAESSQTGDNAGMIAFSAFADPEGALDDRGSLSINPSWKIA